ncbi:beta-beta-alpha zinc fingers domain-containing protein [Dioscorea alata]|uniref:Beta-beta-alpha zinc fingers domain-containing protein n=1 Tax=Dioscorea alata TaxID=55571 RepID=A0ACB7VTS0_DIOAL|nr:beta-beta-alpha zinc fingers domain-containing protein [Dioscorea alata]
MKHNESEEMSKRRSVADILMLLSRQENIHKLKSVDQDVFKCKTCGRVFSSFQALGGHRTSHRRQTAGLDDHKRLIDMQLKMTRMMMKKKKKKTHECSVCGLEFVMGQALGGHMRRHKPVSVKKVLLFDLNLTPLENDNLNRAKYAD